MKRTSLIAAIVISLATSSAFAQKSFRSRGKSMTRSSGQMNRKVNRSTNFRTNNFKPTTQRRSSISTPSRSLTTTRKTPTRTTFSNNSTSKINRNFTPKKSITSNRVMPKVNRSFKPTSKLTGKGTFGSSQVKRSGSTPNRGVMNLLGNKAPTTKGRTTPSLSGLAGKGTLNRLPNRGSQSNLTKGPRNTTLINPNIGRLLGRGNSGSSIVKGNREPGSGLIPNLTRPGMQYVPGTPVTTVNDRPAIDIPNGGRDFSAIDPANGFLGQPVDTQPGGNLPGDRFPGQPGGNLPGDRFPGQPGDNLPGDRFPGQPGDNLPGDRFPGDGRPNQPGNDQPNDGGQPNNDPADPGQPGGNDPVDPGNDPVDPGNDPMNPGQDDPVDPGQDPHHPGDDQYPCPDVFIDFGGHRYPCPTWWGTVFPGCTYGVPACTTGICPLPAAGVVVDDAIVDAPITDAPAEEVLDIPEAVNGDELTVLVENAGDTEGKAVLEVAGRPMLLTITDWQPTYVTVQLPKLLLRSATEARLYLASSEGQLVDVIDLRIVLESSDAR